MRNSIIRILFTASLATSSCVTLAQDFHPCRWHLEIEPFYATPTDTLLSNSIYAIKIADPAISSDFKEQYHLNPEHAWGARFAVGFDWNCRNSVSLDGTIFNHQNSTSIINDSRSNTGLPVLAPAEFIDITDESSARFSFASTRLDQEFLSLSLLAHKKYDFHCGTYLKLFGGIRYMFLKETLKNRYDFAGEIEEVRVQNHYQVNYENNSGNAGPEIGALLYYSLIGGLALKAQLSTAFLYGESDSQFNNAYTLSPDSTLGSAVNLTSHNHLNSTGNFVPAALGKIGIAYQTSFCHCQAVGFEVGYRGERYFHAINDTAYQQLLAGDDINSNSNYQDFILTGPYLNLTVAI